MFPSHYQCNGETKTFENYMFHITGWMMQIGMGYMLLPAFTKAYRVGGWTHANYTCPNIYDLHFQHDNQILYGSLTSYAHNCAHRYFLTKQLTMDGLKVWFKLRDQFNGENNVLLQTMQYLKLLDRPFSTSTTGGILGYIDQIMHLLNQLDVIDPECTHHVSYNNQQKMSLILRRFSDIDPYARIMYDYYMQMTATGNYNVDKYVEDISRLCQHIDPHSVNLKPFRAYNDESDPSLHANFAGQPSNRPPPQPGVQPTGYRNFLFLTPQEFDHRKTHHPDLNNRLRSLRVGVAEALVPVRGPLPPGIVKLLGELKSNKPRPDSTRPDVPLTPHPQIPDASGLPAQYPPRQPRANSVQREITALNLYTADDPSYDDLDADQWGTSGYDTHDDLTNDEDDYDDRYINIFRTVSLPKIRILYTHHTSEFVSVIDVGADTMVLGIIRDVGYPLKFWVG
jgi:hypothetical protein